MLLWTDNKVSSVFEAEDIIYGNFFYFEIEDRLCWCLIFLRRVFLVDGRDEVLVYSFSIFALEKVQISRIFDLRI